MTADEFATLEVGDIVQIDPAHNPTFGSCCLQVEATYAWGVQGPVVVPTRPASALAYCRIAFAHIERIGRARWTPTGLFITDLTGSPAGVAREAAGGTGVAREATGEAHPDAPRRTEE